MIFFSKPPRYNSKVIALYNSRKDNVITNQPFSFNVTNRYDKNINGAWKPIALTIKLEDLNFKNLNEFNDEIEKHFIFSDGLFLFFFITDNSNKLIRIIGSSEMINTGWEFNQDKNTLDVLRNHKNNVKILNNEIYLKYCQEIIDKIVAQ